MGDEYLKELTRGGKKYVCLDFSYYWIVENYLVETYLIRTYTPLSLAVYFNSYILLWKHETLNLDQINEKIENIISIERDLKSTTRRIVEEMSSKGIIEKLKLGNRVIYRRKEDPLRDLTDNELSKLYIGVCYFSQVNYPIVLGRYLRDSLRRYMQCMRGISTKDLDNLFLFKYSNFQQVIDEEIIWSLEHIIQNRDIAKVTYYDEQDIQRVLIGYPCKIIWDNSYGKWYIYIITDGCCLRVLKAQDIIAVDVLNRKMEVNHIGYAMQEAEDAGDKKLKKINIMFEVEEFSRQNFLLDKVKRKGLNGDIQILDDHRFIYTLYVEDWYRLKPWIMSFGNRARVIEDEETQLYREIKEEWLEMGELYGVVHGAEE